MFSLAASLGWIIPDFGWFVVAGVIGLPLLVLVLGRPLVGAALLAATLPLESLLTVGDSITGTRLLGVVIFALWSIHKLFRPQGLRKIFTHRHFQAAVLVLAVASLSTLWAFYVIDAYLGLLSLLQLILFSVLILDVVDSWPKIELFAKVLLLMGVVTAVLTLQQYYLENVRRAGGDIAGGINGTAAMLVSILPFALYLVRAGRGFWRVAGIVYLPVSVWAVAVTFSRTSYLLLVAVGLVQLALALRDRRRISVLLAVVLVLVLIANFLPQEAIRSRVETIVPAITNMFDTVSGRGTVTKADSRAFHWAVGFQMFRDNPLLGTGYNNYGRHFLHYQNRVPNPDQYYVGIRSAHSSYVAFLANQGLVGLMVWLGFFALTGAAVVRLWRRLSCYAGSREFLLVETLGIIFLIHLLYGFSSLVHQEKLFWMNLGLLAASARIADNEQLQREEASTT